MGGKSSELMRSDRYRKIIQNKKGKCERSRVNLELETWFWSEILICRDKHHGRKLDARWICPRILTEITSSGVSGVVQELYGGTG